MTGPFFSEAGSIIGCKGFRRNDTPFEQKQDTFLTRRTQVVTGRGFLVMRGPVNRNDGDGSDCCEYGDEHDNDEFSRAVCGLGRGLGDSHGVDEGVRDEEEELHIDWMLGSNHRSKNRG